MHLHYAQALYAVSAVLTAGLLGANLLGYADLPDLNRELANLQNPPPQLATTTTVVSKRRAAAIAPKQPSKDAATAVPETTATAEAEASQYSALTKKLLTNVPELPSIAAKETGPETPEGSAPVEGVEEPKPPVAKEEMEAPKLISPPRLGVPKEGPKLEAEAPKAPSLPKMEEILKSMTKPKEEPELISPPRLGESLKSETLEPAAKVEEAKPMEPPKVISPPRLGERQMEEILKSMTKKEEPSVPSELPKPGAQALEKEETPKPLVSETLKPAAPPKVEEPKPLEPVAKEEMEPPKVISPPRLGEPLVSETLKPSAPPKVEEPKPLEPVAKEEMEPSKLISPPRLGDRTKLSEAMKPSAKADLKPAEPAAPAESDLLSRYLAEKDKVSRMLGLQPKEEEPAAPAKVEEIPAPVLESTTTKEEKAVPEPVKEEPPVPVETEKDRIVRMLSQVREQSPQVKKAAEPPAKASFQSTATLPVRVSAPDVDTTMVVAGAALAAAAGALFLEGQKGEEDTVPSTPGGDQPAKPSPDVQTKRAPDLPVQTKPGPDLPVQTKPSSSSGAADSYLSALRSSDSREGPSLPERGEILSWGQKPKPRTSSSTGSYLDALSGGSVTTTTEPREDSPASMATEAPKVSPRDSQSFGGAVADFFSSTKEVTATANGSEPIKEKPTYVYSSAKPQPVVISELPSTVAAILDQSVAAGQGDGAQVGGGAAAAAAVTESSPPPPSTLQLPERGETVSWGTTSTPKTSSPTGSYLDALSGGSNRNP